MSNAPSQIDISGQLEEVSSAGGPAIQTDLGRIISSFIGAALIIGAIATLGYMIMAGIQWITAGGDTGKIQKARDKFIQSIIGLALLASTYAIFLVIQFFFGINIAGGSLNGGSSGGAGTPGGGTADVCTVNQTGSDGGAGNYCNNGGTATMKCFGPGQGVSKYPYNHWEPCSCNPAGSEKSGVNFGSC